MSLVNDLNYSLETPCKEGILGRLCREDDYKSWRRVAVSIRKTVLAGDYSDQPAVYGDVMSWLGEWVQPVAECGVLKWAPAAGAARQEADPDIKCGRFPRTLRFWKGEYDPRGPTYNEQTRLMIGYIKNGWSLVKKAIDEGAIDEDDISTELERAEVRPEEVKLPRWARYTLGGAIVAGVSIFVVWAIGTIKGTRE